MILNWNVEEKIHVHVDILTKNPKINSFHLSSWILSNYSTFKKSLCSHFNMKSKVDRQQCDVIVGRILMARNHHQWTFFYERLILWFYVEMLRKSRDVKSVGYYYERWFYDFVNSGLSDFLLKYHHPFELDHGWFHDFKLICWWKLAELDPDWFYTFKLKIKDVESWPINSWPWLWINFMILCWNVEENKLTLTRFNSMILSWNVEKD